jgi:hypothetical protein
VTADALAVNPTLVAFAGTLTVAGTFTAVVLVAKLTLTPLPVAALSVTVQVSLPEPVIEELLQDNEFKTIWCECLLTSTSEALGGGICADTILHTDRKNISNVSVRRVRKYAFRLQEPLM